MRGYVRGLMGSVLISDFGVGGGAEEGFGEAVEASLEYRVLLDAGLQSGERPGEEGVVAAQP